MFQRYHIPEVDANLTSNAEEGVCG